MRSSPAAGLLLLSSLPLHAAMIEVRPEEARPARVTVYVDRAEVVREVKLTLPAGDSEVVVSGIPAGIEADSIRVRAHGTPATLGAVQVRDEVREPEPRPESATAERDVRRLAAEIAALDAEAAVDAELQAFLASMKAVTATTASKSLAEAKLDAKSVEEMYGFVRTSLHDLKQRELQRGERRRLLQEELTVARATLEAGRPKDSIHSRVATVDVQADRGGSLVLQMAYVVSGAGWRPVYRATLDAEGEHVELVREAVVRQRTGEDWTDVALTLSTALPARGVEPPTVTTWLVRAMAPPNADSIEEMEVGAKMGRRTHQNAPTAAPGGVAGGVLGGFLQAEQAANAPVEIVETAYDVSFVVPTSADVPADGREHRVVLQRASYPVSLSYYVAPALRPAAFLTGTLKLPEGAPLLRGPVRISNGAAYLGTFLVGETAPGAELRLPFGEDPRVKVTRVDLPQERSREGLGDRTRHTVATFRTRLHNLRETPVRVRLEEALPVSEDERIRVDLTRTTTAGSMEDPDRPGVRRWDLELAPREQRELEVGYEMRWPKDVVVALR